MVIDVAGLIESNFICDPRYSHQGFRPRVFPAVLISFPETLLLFSQIIKILSNQNARFTFLKVML